jgi:hypothetical protein
MGFKTLGQQDACGEIAGRLSRLTPDAKPRWGRMSACGMVCHLSDSFRVAAGTKTASMAFGVVERSVFKWIALYLPLKWPTGIQTRPEVDQERGGTKPSEFEADRRELIELMRRFCLNPPGRGDALHPIFGSMTSAQWLRWAYLHMDHHLRQFGV